MISMSSIVLIVFLLFLKHISTAEKNLENHKFKSSFAFTFGRWHPSFAKAHKDFKHGHPHPRSKFHETIVSVFRPYVVPSQNVPVPFQNGLTNFEDSSLKHAPKPHIAPFKPLWHSFSYGKNKENLATKDTEKSNDDGQEQFSGPLEALKTFPDHAPGGTSDWGKLMNVFRQLDDGLERDINRFLMSARIHGGRRNFSRKKEHRNNNILHSESGPPSGFKVITTRTGKSKEGVEARGSALKVSDSTSYQSRFHEFKNNRGLIQNIAGLESNEPEKQDGVLNNTKDTRRKHEHYEPSRFNFLHQSLPESQSPSTNGSSNVKMHMLQSGDKRLNSLTERPTVRREQSSVLEGEREKLQSMEAEKMKNSKIIKKESNPKVRKGNLDSRGSPILNRGPSLGSGISDIRAVDGHGLRYLRDVGTDNNKINKVAETRKTGSKGANDEATKKVLTQKQEAKGPEGTSNDKNVAGVFVLFDNKKQPEKTESKKPADTNQGNAKTGTSKSHDEIVVHNVKTGTPEVQKKPMDQHQNLPKMEVTERFNASASHHVLVLPGSAWSFGRHGQRKRRTHRINNHAVVGVVLLCAFMGFVIILGFTIVRVRNEESGIRRVNSRTRLYENHPFY